MSTLILYKYRVYCVTEAAYVTIWLDEDQAAPTTCPNNPAHTITPSLTKIIDIRNPNTLSVVQTSGEVTGAYKFDTKAFTATANTITSYSFSYPLDINVLDTQFIAAVENTGDTWTWSIGENTTIGVLSADVGIGDTVIHVTSALTYAKVGYYLNLFDGVNTDDMGLVTALDKINGTITLQTPTTHAFLASTPTYVRMSVFFMRDAEFGHPWCLEYGASKILSSFVPKNTVIKVSYTNNTGVDKRIVCNIEYIY